MIRLGRKTIFVASLFSVSAASAGALAGTLGKLSTKFREQPILELQDHRNTKIEDDSGPDVLLSSKGILNTKKVSREENQPPLAISKGGCFSSFFPEVNLTRPTKYSNKNIKEIIPANFNLGQSPLLGCKLMKLSRAKQDAAFGYLSEITVQNDQYGLAFFASVTNIRQKTQTDLEYWVLFLQKQGTQWKLLDSWYWTLLTGMQTTGNGFGTQTPTEEQWKLKPVSGHNDTFQKFFNSEDQDQSNLWQPDDSDLFYSGIWQTDNDGKYLFEEGSHERWALSIRFDPSSSKPKPMNFLQETSLTQKGKWKTAKDYCASIGGKDPSAPSEPNKGLCPKAS